MERDEAARELVLKAEGALFELTNDLLSFFHDRLKVYLRDKGARHDLIDAVLAAPNYPSSGPAGHLLPQGEKEKRGIDDGVPSPLVGEGGSRSETGEGYSPAAKQEVEERAEATPPGRFAATLRSRGREASRAAEGRASDRTPGDLSPAPAEAGERSERAAVSDNNDDLLVIVRKVEALGAFLDTDDGRNLLAGAKRAANILAAEEKKGTAIAGAVDPALFRDEAETVLFAAVNRAENEAGQAIQNQDYSGAMRALSVLREPVDSFFERVHVNDEDADVRANRLALLRRIRAATDRVADFSKIAG